MLGAFNEETPDWLSFFMFTYFTDRDGKMQLESLAQSGFDPLSRTCRFMLTEEAHHMFVGETGVARIIERTCEAMKAAGSKNTEAVAQKLKELPVDDAFAQGKVLPNGRMVHDMYLFEVKKPSESKKPWDYYKQLAVVPGDKAFFTAKESGCPLTK